MKRFLIPLAILAVTAGCKKDRPGVGKTTTVTYHVECQNCIMTVRDNNNDRKSFELKESVTNYLVDAYNFDEAYMEVKVNPLSSVAMMIMKSSVSVNGKVVSSNEGTSAFTHKVDLRKFR